MMISRNIFQNVFGGGEGGLEVWYSYLIHYAFVKIILVVEEKVTKSMSSQSFLPCITETDVIMLGWSIRIMRGRNGRFLQQTWALDEFIAL